MRVLTRKTQKEIEENRNVVYKYLVSTPVGAENVKQFEEAIGALANMSCLCDIWSKPYEISDNQPPSFLENT